MSSTILQDDVLFSVFFILFPINTKSDSVDWHKRSKQIATHRTVSRQFNSVLVEMERLWDVVFLDISGFPDTAKARAWCAGLLERFNVRSGNRHLTLRLIDSKDYTTVWEGAQRVQRPPTENFFVDLSKTRPIHTLDVQLTNNGLVRLFQPANKSKLETVSNLFIHSVSGGSDPLGIEELLTPLAPPLNLEHLSTYGIDVHHLASDWARSFCIRLHTLEINDRNHNYSEDCVVQILRNSPTIKNLTWWNRGSFRFGNLQDQPFIHYHLCRLTFVTQSPELFTRILQFVELPKLREASLTISGSEVTLGVENEVKGMLERMSKARPSKAHPLLYTVVRNRWL